MKKMQQEEMKSFLAGQHSFQQEKLRQEDLLLNEKEFGVNKQLLKNVGLEQVK